MRRISFWILLPDYAALRGAWHIELNPEGEKIFPR